MRLVNVNALLGVWLALMLPGLPIAQVQAEEIPLRYRPEAGESLPGVADRFGISLDHLRSLNAGSFGPGEALLLVDTPRNREEAIEMLEEARHAESLGGESVAKAKTLYAGILRAAGLGNTSEGVPAEETEVEIPSETVAQALLGWGRMSEVEDPEAARLSYQRVVTYFPDLEELAEKASRRLSALHARTGATLTLSPPSALRLFPRRPLVVLDIDASLLETQYPEISLHNALGAIPDLEKEAIEEILRRLERMHTHTLLALAQLESLHIGGWLDDEEFGRDPEGALAHPTFLAIGKLRVTESQAQRNLDLGGPEGTYKGVDYHRLERNLCLFFREGWVYVGNQETLELTLDTPPNQANPILENPEGGYQRMRAKVGAGCAVFGYLDLEGFLAGPGYQFARHANFEKREEFYGSLLLSGVLGINSVEGLALGLAMEEGMLSANLALAHGGKGLFRILQADLCESTVPRYFPADLDAMAIVHLSCKNLVEHFEQGALGEVLGVAAPIYLAQYDNALRTIARSLEVEIDPLSLLEEGFATEMGIGIEMPAGIIPLPNVVMVLPVGESETVGQALERVMTAQFGIDFADGEVGGIAFRHGIVPEIQPFLIDFSYVVRDGVLVAATHPDLMKASLDSAAGGENLNNNPSYRGFRDSVPTPDNLQIYLGAPLATQLAMWGKSQNFLPLIHESQGALRTIVKESLDRVVTDPKASGLGIALEKDRVQASLRLAHFRPWLVSYLCVSRGRSPVAEEKEKGESDSANK